MNRREMLSGLGGMATLSYGPLASAQGPSEETVPGWPFQASAVNRWTEIKADGFSSLVVGYVYEGRRLEGGLPLGALGTGYMTLEGNGKLGFCSIFNDLVPPRKLFTDWLVVESGAHRIPLSIADIQYWGHYPVADLSARFDESPVEIGIRAFTPFIVGDAAASNTPVALFNLELRNVSDVSFPVTLHLNFPLDVP